MNSIIYVYSKFTEEFLLFCAAGVFALLSIYCYYWVIQKRRLGVARSQIPSAVVRGYLAQLIGEAEFVRKQLFGMTEGSENFTIPQGFGMYGAPQAPVSADPGAPISPDLLARMGSLESQLREKESLVVNINIEKNKLLTEIENLKTNGAANAGGNQNELVDKIKNLEARLEEYSLFEEDLANLKRLQQENNDLKKKLLEAASAPAAAPAPAPAPAPVAAAPAPAPAPEKPALSVVPDPAPAPAPAAPAEAAPAAFALDQDAIDALLGGESATPPSNAAAPAPAPAAAPATAPVTSSDQFENLVDSVETSLEAKPAAAAAPAPAPVQAASSGEKLSPEAAADAAVANKTDEELLKEFENLLNS